MSGRITSLRPAKWKVKLINIINRNQLHIYLESSINPVHHIFSSDAEDQSRQVSKPLQHQKRCWRCWQLKLCGSCSDPFPPMSNMPTAMRERMKRHLSVWFCRPLWLLCREGLEEGFALGLAWCHANDHPDQALPPKSAVLNTWNKPTASLHTCLPINSLFLMC